MKNEKLKCCVCENDAIGVCCSSLGPISNAYCAECLQKNREPYSMMVSVLEISGIANYEDVGDISKEMVDSTLSFYNKTVEDFNNDLKAHKEMMKDCQY